MPTLNYVGDPMCSWCWGFAPVLEDVATFLPKGVEVEYVMGGLAPDSDDPMPAEVRQYVQENWREVTKTTGAQFNWDFWEKCQPRRSTYPACRAALAAGLQDALPRMFDALQRAYYLEARNPSDSETHIEVAKELGLDVDRFANDLLSAHVETLLQADFAKRRELGVREFPTITFQDGTGYVTVMRGWASSRDVLDRLRSLLNEAATT